MGAKHKKEQHLGWHLSLLLIISIQLNLMFGVWDAPF